MRLIDADALQKEHMKYNDGKRLMLVDVAPTIDAVDVVRCENCRYANECHKSVQYARNELNTVAIGSLPIEWCSRGERKDESETNDI